MKNLFPIVLLVMFFGCKKNVKGEQTVILENAYLKVKAKKIGAELISIQSLKNQIEYLWQGDSITWADHAILQFPFIGNLKNDQYEFNGKQYEMMSHGFARISDFEVVDKSSNKVVFQLKSNRDTHKRYPFDFVFRLSYELKENVIRVIFNVENTGDSEMYFSLGYHPGFNCPIKIGEKMEDYYLEFSQEESVDRLLMKDNLIESLQSDYLSGVSKIPLSKAIFQEDAIILKDISSTSLSLKNVLNDKSVTVTFGDVPYLGIWSPKKYGDFVCIEPWFGIADFSDSNSILQDKEGIMQLSQQKEYHWECNITIN